MVIREKYNFKHLVTMKGGRHNPQNPNNLRPRMRALLRRLLYSRMRLVFFFLVDFLEYVLVSFNKLSLGSMQF